MSETTPARDLRVSTAEREHVAELLARHMAAGRITPDEYTDRLDVVTASITRADLNSVMIDLPGAVLSPSLATDVLDLSSTMGDLRRVGEWVVPATVRATTWMGNVRIDFTEARFTSPVITVELSVTLGNVVLVLPPKATADVTDTHVTLGKVDDRTGGAFDTGTPHLVVRGVVRCGNLKLKYRRRF